MALTQEQVDWWFSQNPNATPEEVAEAVKSVGGLEGNEGLASMIANRYAIAEPEVTDYYNKYTAPKVDTPTFTDTILAGTPTTEDELLTALSDNTSTVTGATGVDTVVGAAGNDTVIGATGNDTTYAASDWPTIISGTTGTDGETLTQTTTSDGTPFYLHDTDEGGYYQNPNTVESYAPFTGADGKTYYNVYAPVFSSGKAWNETPITSVLTEAQYRALKGGDSAIKNMLNSPVGSFALNVLGPWGQVINAANAIDNGNITGAVLSSLNAAQGFGVTNLAGFDVKDIQNVARGLNAVDQKNWAGAFTAGSNLVGGTSGDFTTAATLASASLALSKNDAAGFASALGDLTNNPDLKVAAAATRLLNAVSSDTINPAALQSAFNSLGTAITKSSSADTTGTKVSDAGEDVTLPGGVQLASLGDGVFRTDVGGTPTFAESKNADSVTTPFGYSLLSATEADNKPEGSYYDPTANAWFKPDTAVTNLTGGANLLSDIDLFTSSQGDLDQIATSTAATSDDATADFLASIGITNTTQLADSGLSNQDILDLINASTVTGGTGDDVEELVVTGTGNKTDTTTIDTITGGTGNDNVDDKGTVVVTGGKESCPVGTTLNPETGDCDPIVTTECAVGFHDDGTGLCVANDDKKSLDCPEGYEPNEAGTACVEVTTIIGKRDPCPPGTKYDEDLDACMPITTECAPGFHDDGSGLCVPDDEPCADGYHKDDSGACVPDDCPEGYVRDMATGQCVLAEEPCKDGYHRDETTGQCVPDTKTLECPEGYKPNEAGTECVPITKTLECPEGYEPNDAGTECIPVIEIKSCPTGFVRDEETGKCVPIKEDNPCAEGFHLENGLCVPDDDEPCKDGYEKVDGVCVPVCKEGYIRNLATGVCEKVEDKGCPPGQTKDANGKCVPITKTTECQPGYERIDGVCVPKCKAGYQRVNGVCVPICQPGYTLVNGVCVPIPTASTSALGAEGEKIDPIYATGMDDFDLFATLEELLNENSDKTDKKKDSKKSKEKTKMATGGHLDDLLAEQMTVDDLLKLLR